MFYCFIIFCNSKSTTLIDVISFLSLMLLLASATTLSFRFSKSTFLVISLADKVKSLLSVEYKSTLISLSFDLILTVTVLLLMFSSGNSDTTGASEGTEYSYFVPYSFSLTYYHFRNNCVSYTWVHHKLIVILE